MRVHAHGFVVVVLDGDGPGATTGRRSGTTDEGRGRLKLSEVRREETEAINLVCSGHVGISSGKEHTTRRRLKNLYD